MLATDGVRSISVKTVRDAGDGDTKNKVTVCLGNPLAWNFRFSSLHGSFTMDRKGERTFGG